MHTMLPTLGWTLFHFGLASPFQQQQKKNYRRVCWIFPNIYVVCGCTVCVEGIPRCFGYIAFQNKYCRHHTNVRLTDGWLWKAVRKSKSMWQQFLTEIVQWLYPLLISFWLFSPFHSTQYSKTPFCPCQKL